jgi:hypothetical protein
MAEKKRKLNINWYPARLLEDPLTGNNYVLMYGGSGRIRFVSVSEIQGPLWNEEMFKRNEK